MHIASRSPLPFAEWFVTWRAAIDPVTNLLAPPDGSVPLLGLDATGHLVSTDVATMPPLPRHPFPPALQRHVPPSTPPYMPPEYYMPGNIYVAPLEPPLHDASEPYSTSPLSRFAFSSSVASTTSAGTLAAADGGGLTGLAAATSASDMAAALVEHTVVIRHDGDEAVQAIIRLAATSGLVSMRFRDVDDVSDADGSPADNFFGVF